MYPAVITILRLVGGYTGDRLAKKYRWILPARYSIINAIPRTEKQHPEAFCNLFAFSHRYMVEGSLERKENIC